MDLNFQIREIHKTKEEKIIRDNLYGSKAAMLQNLNANPNLTIKKGPCLFAYEQFNFPKSAFLINLSIIGLSLDYMNGQPLFKVIFTREKKHTLSSEPTPPSSEGMVDSVKYDSFGQNSSSFITLSKSLHGLLINPLQPNVHFVCFRK